MILSIRCKSEIFQIDFMLVYKTKFSEPGTNCPHGVSVVNCLIDPCQRKTCSDQKATCVSNYCGGCNAVFYDYTGQNEAKCLRK